MLKTKLVGRTKQDGGVISEAETSQTTYNTNIQQIQRIMKE